MPFISYKEWIVPLSEGFHIVVRRSLRRGEITDFTVVLVFDDQCISRYDTAHGVAHRDVLGEKHGLLKKEWYENLPRKEVFKNAIQDFTYNHWSYLYFFRAN